MGRSFIMRGKGYRIMGQPKRTYGMVLIIRGTAVKIRFVRGEIPDYLRTTF